MFDKLILGTVQLGVDYGINNEIGKPSIADALSILEYAYKKKIRFLDTAEAYGDAQKIIGKPNKYWSEKCRKQLRNKKHNEARAWQYR